MSGAAPATAKPARHERPAAGASSAGPAALGTNDGPAPLRVLLVEDHADTARMMARLLRASGYEVRTAGTLADAVSSARGGPFDLLISDLGLPDGTGLDLIRDLRSRPYVGPFRAIALSGYGMEEDLRQTREAGFAAHLTKPVSFDDLDGVIRRVAGAVAHRGN